MSTSPEYMRYNRSDLLLRDEEYLRHLQRDIDYLMLEDEMTQEDLDALEANLEMVMEAREFHKDSESFCALVNKKYEHAYESQKMRYIIKKRYNIRKKYLDVERRLPILSKVRHALTEILSR